MYCTLPTREHSETTSQTGNSPRTLGLTLFDEQVGRPNPPVHRHTPDRVAP